MPRTSDNRSIGWGIARSLAEAGADVVVNDYHRLDDLESRVEDLRALGRRGLAPVTRATLFDKSMEHNKLIAYSKGGWLVQDAPFEKTACS